MRSANVSRASLIQTKYFRNTPGGVMPAKRLLGRFIPVVLLASSAWAQMNYFLPVNDFSATAGTEFVSTQTVYNTGLSFNPSLHFARPWAFAFNYSRLLKTAKIFGIRAELPVGIYPRMDLNLAAHGIPNDIGALFVTPSVRVNIFSNDNVSPWVSVGGGYGRFRYAHSDEFYGTNTGPSGSNTGVVQFGTGLDVWFWDRWGFRGEARDFYSGEPSYNVDTNRSRQHNYYVGVGFLHRF
ncbi:MAG: hypothetical protein WA213_12655 [Terriglobales bacterium]